HDPCLLVRLDEATLVAYSQACTHLSCAVVPRVAEGVLHCPCHEGYFDLLTGRNIAGPPPRPLPKILIGIQGADVFATGGEATTVQRAQASADPRPTDADHLRHPLLRPDPRRPPALALHRDDERLARRGRGGRVASVRRERSLPALECWSSALSPGREVS